MHNDPPGLGSTNNAEPAPLSKREREVLRAWIMASTRVAAAQQLFISLSTLTTHLARIRAKYAAVGRPAPTKAALIGRALQDGIVTLDELG